MQLYFIRHAQSTNNSLWDDNGSNHGRSEDAELTDKGRRQAGMLADFLRQADANSAPSDLDPHNASGFHFTHLYTSLMVRAVATGVHLARALDLPLVAWPDLHESGGIYLEDARSGRRIGRAGKNRAYFEAHYPDLVLPDSLGEAGWWNRPYEQLAQRWSRAERVRRELMRRHATTDDRVAIIAHGGFYNHFVEALLHLPRHTPGRVPRRLRDVLVRLKLARVERHWFALNNVAITRIDFRDGVTQLMYLNRADFLPGDLIT
jgi:2,3-bisphosphoglycerate-dependent phosphoglycerate mutase